jgi:hypothetical protein
MLPRCVQVSDPQQVPEHGVTVVFVELPNTKIELLHPLGAKSPIQKFLDRNPAGDTYEPCSWPVVMQEIKLTISRHQMARVPPAVQVHFLIHYVAVQWVGLHSLWSKC